MSTKINKEDISKVIAMAESPIYVPINNSIITNTQNTDKNKGDK